jgi:hypothetical protein
MGNEFKKLQKRLLDSETGSHANYSLLRRFRADEDADR